MKHQLDEMLHAGVRRELREAPAGIAERVRARIALEPGSSERPAPRLSWRAVASLAAAGLLAYALWPSSGSPVPGPQTGKPTAPGSDVLDVVDLTRQGIQYAARIDRPLADEWQLMVQNSLQLRDALLEQVPKLPR